MKIKGLIPNLLTISRVFLTILAGGLLIEIEKSLRNDSFVALFLLISGAIFVSDILDGKLARRWGSCTAFGAKADVLADLCYIISQDALLVYYHKMNRWILLIVMLEFLVFLITAQKVSDGKRSSKNWFDKIGRIAAGYYYAMPMGYFLINQVGQEMTRNRLFVMGGTFCFFLTLAAILNRLRICFFFNNQEWQVSGKA